jgi:hypothetical protein
VRRQHGLDFAGLDAQAAQLDLMIDAAEELDVAVGAVAREVAGAVEARVRVVGERVGDELLGAQIRLVVIAAAHRRTADQQLAGHADRRGLQLCVDDVDARVRNRPADRHDALRVVAPAFPRGHVDRGLGGAVQVVQLDIQALEATLLEVVGNASPLHTTRRSDAQCAASCG